MVSDFCENLLDEYTDSEPIRHIAAAPSCDAFVWRTRNLSPNLIAKHYQPSEIDNALKAAKFASQLGIRSTSIRRVIKNEATAYTVMSRIEGTTLDTIWEKLGWLMTIKLGLQLRRFVKILRSVTSPTAGSLVTGACRSFWLEDRFELPAHSGPADLAHFFRFWGNFTSMKRAMQEAKQPRAPDWQDATPLTIEPFVLTHGNLAPRNLLVSPSGEFWLMDWDLAGFYPATFEYAGIYSLDMPREWGSWIGCGGISLFVWRPGIMRPTLTCSASCVRDSRDSLWVGDLNCWQREAYPDA